MLIYLQIRFSYVSVCGDHNFCTSKKNSLFYQLKSLSTAPTDLNHYYNASKSSPNQFFHILDNRTKSVLLSWPDHYPNEMDGAQMHILDDRPMSPGISCFHCVQQTIRTTLSGQKINSFIIEYGSIAFVLVQVKKRYIKNIYLFFSLYTRILIFVFVLVCRYLLLLFMIINALIR